ncbi:mercuric transporter MerT family protein [Piscinibacter koreensis]|uniref:Mercuric transport protein MerT n=1 Tax=Piscinibacter koreensis TaxID=2742824 RepID=A0A7Y6TZA0_9BURK|nr:mercuric transporter MerT family protein [Schlegelella koreensis]NUZ08886.1 mercury transporter MerT [Schlegelella koreensis]
MQASERSASTRWATPGSVLAGLAAAIGASACCAGPLVLVLLGVGGAWGSRLVALEPLQPYFVAAALVFFGVASYRLYRGSERCAPDEVCAIPAVRRRQRVIFWSVSVLAAALMSFPLYAPLFY